MKIRAFLKYGSVALLLCVVAFVLAIGTLTLAFDPKIGTYAPKSSSDAASWIQAIGSIGAIIGAFLIGERQAKRERNRLDDARAKSEGDLQRAQLAIVSLLHEFGQRFGRAYDAEESSILQVEWDTALKNSVRAALNAFDAMPLHELKSSNQAQAAAEVRSTVQSIYDITASYLNGRPFAIDDPDTEKAFRKARGECEIHLLALNVGWFGVTRSWPSEDL